LIENEENLQLAENYSSELRVFKAVLRAFQPYELDEIKRPVNYINKEIKTYPIQVKTSRRRALIDTSGY